MKPNLFFILAIPLLFIGSFLPDNSSAQTCNGRRIVLHPDSNLGSYNNGRSDFYPGDTILLNDNLSNGSPGVFSEMWFQVRGTASCPIIFMNDPALDHPVRIRGLSGQIALLHCQYVKFTGSGLPGTEYGISIDHSTSTYPHGGGFYGINVSGRSKSIQLERIAIRNCTIGLHIKQDPGCIDSLNYVYDRQPGDPWYPNFVLDSIVVNNCSVVGSANEGMYIGNTGPDNSPPSAGDLTYQHRWYICPGVNPPGDPNGDSTYPEPMRMGNVHIYNNYVDSSGRGGIQVAAHDGVSPTEIDHNIVRHSGMLGMYGQGVGISVGPYQAPYIHDNTIISTTSEGIATFGGLTNQPIRIENNYIDSSGYQDYYLHGESTYYPAENWTIVPNTNTYPFTSMYIVSRQVKYNVEGDSIQFVIKNNRFGINKSVIPDGNGNVHVFQLEDYRQLMQQNPGSYVCNNTLLDSITPAIRPGHDVQASTLGTYPNPYRNPQLPPAFSMTCIGNQSPYANAGLPQTILLPTSQVILTGSGIDLDGTIASYSWTQVSGTAATITSPSSASTTITGLTTTGVRVFRLTVTDNLGASGTADVTITVSISNLAPTANAGSPQTIILPTSTVSLTGSGTDPDGTIVSYGWIQINGTPATIVSPSSASTSITGLTTTGIRVFRLLVIDNQGASAIADVTITVNAASNQAPTANAGSPQTITLPTSTVSLTGSGTDPDGTIASYGWTQMSGTTATIVSPSSASTTITGLTTAGVRVFRLLVIDNQGASAIADVTITVNPAANQAPTANAGSPQTITLPTSIVTLTGSGTDPDGTIASYSWAQVSGAAATIASPSLASTTIMGLTTTGIRIFRLTVTDNQGATGISDVTIIVNNAGNQAPIANAGLPQTIILPTSTVNLTGSGTDPDGTIASYGWTQISGTAATITSSSSALTTITGLTTAGVRVFRLTVTDNQGASGIANVTITVDAINQAPTANAGSPQTITLPTSTVNLTGSGTDPDGIIASYNWTQISGTPATIASPSSASTSITGLTTAGVRVFRLTVTDNRGASGTATVTITVNAAANRAPTANAGSSQTITLPVDSVTVAGSGTDPDGSVVAYRWSKIGGPVSFTIVLATQAQTIINNLVQGEYLFELKVTDNRGAIAKDTVTIIVKEGLQASSAMLFPNPATTTVNVEIDAVTHANKTYMAIYDSRGQIVYQEEFVRTLQRVVRQIDISKLPQGLYLIKISVDINNEKTLKFVKH
jgi:Secretion system C-terminal sorting domain/Bacterial Ig domain